MEENTHPSNPTIKKNIKMNTSNTKFPKKFEASFVYNDNLGRLWSIITDIKAIEDITSKSFLCDIFLLDNLNDVSNLSFKADETKIWDYSKTITWIISNPNDTTIVIMKFSIVLNTWDNTTLFTVCLTINNWNLPEISYKSVIQSCKKWCIDLIENIDNYLKNNPSLLYDYEAIEVNCNRNWVWDYISNFKFLLKKKVKILNENPKDAITANTMMKWQIEGHSEICSCKVVCVENNEKRMKWKYEIMPFDGPLKLQIVKFVMIKINEEKTFLSIFHDFKEMVLNEQWEFLKENKKKVWLDLKKEIEESNKKEKEKENERNHQC